MSGRGRYLENVDPDRLRDFKTGEDILVRQIIASLTALGNYLGAAQHIVGQAPDLDTDLLGVSLERASWQFDQVSKTVRRLQHLLQLGDEEIAAEGEMVLSRPKGASAV